MPTAHSEITGAKWIFDGAICMLFEGRAPMGVGIAADIIGLIVTLERYFKIVHAIAHRKYYRNWMTKVAVALPWIGGVCLGLFPAFGTTRVVNGQCLRLAVWPNEAMAKVSTEQFLSPDQVSYICAPVMLQCKTAIV